MDSHESLELIYKFHIPRSLMLYTPLAAAELALRAAAELLVSLGDEDRPWTAESTLVSGSDMLIVVIACRQRVC